MLRFLFVLACASFALIISGCASGETRIGLAAEPVVIKNSVRTATLANGVTVITKDAPEGSPTSIQVWVAAGSLGEPSGRPGIAHFTEHMLFTGSQHVPTGRAEQYLETMGGKIAGHTGRDYSYIGATIPGKGWERSTQILFDMAVNPLFVAEQVEKQKKIILLELASRESDPETLLGDNLFRTAYSAHPYRNSIIGTADDIRRITRESLLDYYSKAYVPSNMTLVVVGPVSHAEVKALAETIFGAMPPFKPGNKAGGKEPFQVRTRNSEVYRNTGLAYASFGWHVSSASDPDFYPLETLNYILGYGRGSRLAVELQEREGIAFDVTSRLLPLKDPGMLVVSMKLRPDDIRRTTDEVMRQLNKLKDELVSDAELARAKGAIENNYMLDNSTAEGIAYSLGYASTVYGAKAAGTFMQNIRSVTALDVQRVAQKYLGQGNYTLSVVKPQDR
jgi:zinc protease